LIDQPDPSASQVVQPAAGDAAMSCHKHFLNLQWEHHRWRRHLVSSEILTMPEMNIWCRVVDKPYVRCDKQSVCEICGKIGQESSCFCDMEVAERCTLRKALVAQSAST
jgi:hypothetical protein